MPPAATSADGVRVTLDAPPKRIVSLVPSQTELLIDLGLEERLVGVTRFCVRPEHLKCTKAIVGGTKNVNVEKVRALAPDLVLANLEENTKEDVEALRSFAPVFVTDVKTVSGALSMIRTVGGLTCTEELAALLAGQIEEGFNALKAFAPLRAAYFIWREPWMSVGGDTFIHDVLWRGGLRNVFGDQARYPEVTVEEVVAARPDVLLFSSEPFPFREKHLAPFREALPHVPSLLVDGELCSWYGRRLRYTPGYLSALRQGIGR